MLAKAGAVVTPKLDISALAKISDGYTAGTIQQAISQVLIPRRLHHQQRKPIVAVEFVASLSRLDLVSIDEEAAFTDWFSKTPMEKLRLHGGGEDEEADKGKGKKDKDKKKK